MHGMKPWYRFPALKNKTTKTLTSDHNRLGEREMHTETMVIFNFQYEINIISLKEFASLILFFSF
jgi:hypothetical protein